MEVIGYSSHKENFLVFLFLGTVLGLVGGSYELLGLDNKTIEELAKEALALSVFSILSVFGLLGALFSGWRRVPKFIAECARRLSLPALRVGLSTGFIASGVTLGLGLGLLTLSFFSDEASLRNGGLALLSAGVFLFGVCWPYFLLAAEVLAIRSIWLQLSAYVYIFFVGATLYKYEQTGFWQFVVTLVFALVIGICLKIRKRRSAPHLTNRSSSRPMAAAGRP